MPLETELRPHPDAPVEFVQARGDSICEFCNQPYWDHPVHNIYEWLHVLCNGKLVKL